ncbi:MAG: LemA family protein [Acidobacteriia bacterium]|nr:LemA family protein [Terriglobia bacterium]
MIAAIAVVVLLLFLIRTYNRLVKLQNRVRNSWADIDVQLSRRHDLVPNLVETVKAYMAHERGTLENVTQARTQAMAAGGDMAARISAEMMLSGALGKMLVTAENYPELQASKNMQLLQEQLSSTENRIAFARQFYNESVLQLNTAIATFPRNLIAGILGFPPATLFAADEGDRGNVQVKI